jgi:hypothetical protein
MRRPHLGEGAQKPEARYHPEDAAVLRNRTPGGVGGGRRKAPSYPMPTEPRAGWMPSGLDVGCSKLGRSRKRARLALIITRRASFE